MSAFADLVRGPTLVLAAITSGLQAGVYYGFAVGVMPGLALGVARTFTAAMQQINVAIVNPWFLLTFLGAPALAAAAAAVQLGRGGAGLVWTVVGLGCALATVVITAAVNVPLNDALAAAGDADPARARTAFEATWVAWNGVRALTSTAALGCLAWAARVGVA
ncbi:MAG: DUF1772 domain-containing protein [Actinomycetota bacterium]|nr:DUF1772 domain-containing protein [Actinomycetota bacterium]